MYEQTTEVLGGVRLRYGLLQRWGAGIVRFIRRKPMGAAGLGIVLLITFVAITAPLVAPHDPYELRYYHIMESPSPDFWFGTDVFGRDVFSRALYGGRVSLYVALVCMLLAAGTGMTLGISSAYIGGKYDLFIQRVVDATSAIPALILALALVSVLPSSVNNVIIAIAIVQTPRITRVIRSAAMSIKATPYIDAATAIGASNFRIMLRHVAPNTFAPLIIIATAAAGSIILTESTLSFLGVGVPLRTISWGGMLSGETREYVSGAPWMALGPGFALSLAVFGINMFGDALRDVLDPKLRGR